MTREEMIENLLHALDKLERMKSAQEAAEQVRQSEKEAHTQEVAHLWTEAAEKDVRIAVLEKELSESRASNVDANHQVEAAKQDKFSGTSKKGIDKKHRTGKGRDDDKDDFDGTSGSAAPQDPADTKPVEGVETICHNKSDIDKGATLMEKVYEKLLAQILVDGAICYCDETWGRQHLKDVTKKVYTWIIGNRKAKAVAYHYDDGSRGRDVLLDLLKGRNIKAMHTDRYTAYYYLLQLAIVQICCGAHVWRKIKEWYERTNDPEARQLLLDLQWLFIQDAQLKEAGTPPEEVLRRRNSAETIEVITRFGARLEKLKLKIDSLPKIGRTAVNYALNMQSRMFRWREDADYDLDNNWCERAARSHALSRKTSLHKGSHRGARVRAILRSFVETCKLEGIGIVNYFTNVIMAICSGRTDYENLLPATIGVAK